MGETLDVERSNRRWSGEACRREGEFTPHKDDSFPRIDAGKLAEVPPPPVKKESRGTRLIFNEIPDRSRHISQVNRVRDVRSCRTRVLRPTTFLFDVPAGFLLFLFFLRRFLVNYPGPVLVL